MQIETASEIAGLRFDRGLKAFPELFTSYMEPDNKAGSPDRKIVAKGPLSPVDVILAAGALPYDFVTQQTLQSIFSGKSSLSQLAVDQQLSNEFSPWHLVAIGAFMSGQNQIPIDLFSTAIGEFDDQLTKSFQVMANSSSKPFLDWEVPRFDPEARAWALDYLKKELKQFFTEMNILNGQHISGDSLRAAIRAGNLLRNDMTEIDAFLARDNVPLPGLEYYLVHVMLGDYSRDPAGLHERLRHLIDELKQRTNNHESAPGVSSTPVRIYIMGDETQELHLFNSIEAAGGVLVGCDFRMPLYYDLVDETNDPLDSMARWIWNMPNNLPLQERIKMELVKIKIQKPNAIILSNVVGSRRLPGVERLVKDIVKEEMGVPVLSIESTLPGENADKIDYQINALIQMIGG